MKRFLKSFLFLCSFVPCLAFAQVNLKLHKDIEALVVNGEAIPLTVVGKSQFNLENGTNQLVVRVSKLVSSGSDFDKFKSDPVVLTFSAANQDLVLSPSRMITADRQIKDFKTNPSFNLIDSDERALSVEQEILPAGPGFLRDYEKELVKFNTKREKSLSTEVGTSDAEVISSQEPIGTKDINHSEELSATSLKSAETTEENKLILMQADFLRMNATEQKKFLKWAVENIRT